MLQVAPSCFSGENLIDAVIREVKEETNIQTEFRSMLTVRHTHKRPFGCSDLYIIFSLKPLTTDIVKCEREISDCRWMDMNECLNHPHIHELNKFFIKTYLDFKERNIKIDCKTGMHEVLKIPYYMYYVCNDWRAGHCTVNLAAYYMQLCKIY